MNQKIQNELNNLLKEKQSFVSKAIEQLRLNKNKEAMFFIRLESAVNQKIENLIGE